MANPVTGSIAELFRAETPSDRAIEFKWLLIRRRNRPFLPKGAQVGLELYSAHRRRAKIWRGAIPLLLSTPAAAIFQRVHFLANEASEIMPFLVDQSGMQGAGILAPAIKFGSLENEKPRFVMLLCDQTNRPVKVIKVGIDKIGRAATEREADFLEKLPANTLGCIRLTGRLSTPHFSAFATAYFPGQSPEDDAGLETLFHSWINPGPEMAVENLDSWQELETVVASASPAAWQALRPALAGKTLRSTLYHGDFAPWNIRAVNSQNLQAFDWESGCLLGVPGWDWFHFIVQTSVLAKRHSAQRVSAEVEKLLQSPRFEKYAAAAAISSIVKPLLLAYLLHHRWVTTGQRVLGTDPDGQPGNSIPCPAKILLAGGGGLQPLARSPGIRAISLDESSDVAAALRYSLPAGHLEHEPGLGHFFCPGLGNHWPAHRSLQATVALSPRPRLLEFFNAFSNDANLRVPHRSSAPAKKLFELFGHTQPPSCGLRRQLGGGRSQWFVVSARCGG